MSPLEQLFALETELHRKLRCEALGTADASALHTSYALQSGYERFLHGAGRVTERDVELLAERYSLAGDARDGFATRDGLTRLLCLPPFGR
jgi:hypothetical protein